MSLTPFIALLQAPAPEVAAATTTSFLGLITRSTLLSQAVLGLLVLLSVASWGIILHKWWAFRRSRRQTAAFLDIFRRSHKFAEVQAACRPLVDSPLVGLFLAGYAELTAQLRTPGDEDASRAGGRPVLKSLTAVDRALMRASVVEVNKLEHRVSFLATTASIAPFVGLFGTVVGIMMSFQMIGATGSTSLAAVGPGIAEALIATAAGLVAAVPAVVGYNHLSNQVRLFAADMDDFAMEFLNIAERNFT